MSRAAELAEWVRGQIGTQYMTQENCDNLREIAAILDGMPSTPAAPPDPAEIVRKYWGARYNKAPRVDDTALARRALIEALVSLKAYIDDQDDANLHRFEDVIVEMDYRIEALRKRGE